MSDGFTEELKKLAIEDEHVVLLVLDDETKSILRGIRSTLGSIGLVVAFIAFGILFAVFKLFRVFG